MIQHGRSSPRIRARGAVRRVRGCDGTRLHSEAFGGGLPIVCCNGLGVSTFFWKYLVEHFSRDRLVILWDYRGHGRSAMPRNRRSAGMDMNARDLKEVLDAHGVSRAVLVGHSMGAQVIFEFYRLFPDRACALVPFLGTFGHPADTFFNTVLSRYVLYGTSALVRRAPGLTAALWKNILSFPYLLPLARLFLIDPSRASADDLLPYLVHLGKFNLEFFFTMATAMQEHTAEDVLPRITVPTLIIGGEDDVFTPAHISRTMHTLIRGSELLMIPGGSHAALVEQPHLINIRMERFLRDHVPGGKPGALNGQQRLPQHDTRKNK